MNVAILPREHRARPHVHGKFLWRGTEKLYLRGVTYGPFHPEPDGSEYHTPQVVSRDFTRMAEAGLNTVRVYTVPPRWLLDVAQEKGLLVLVGLPWEQHITFLDDPGRADKIEARIRSGVRAFAGHPALLGFTIGNEIPASIVRWHGRKSIERFLRRLYEAAKQEDPGALITYVNFPTTEYLDLDFLDFVCFNVYLESKDRLEAYLGRLQNLAEAKPLVMAEIGLDSQRNGEEKQAETLRWQIQTVFSSGAAGAFVFAWTDEWHRGGHDIDDWDFGLTTRAGKPKPALKAVGSTFADALSFCPRDWPKFSIVVCTYNGSRTIRDTLDHLATLPYPNFETIVVSDGSTDGAADIARGYVGVLVIETTNQGLSSARNTGMRAATGEIIAYIDDDAYPDPHWLHYMAYAFRNSSHVAIGGPNLPPPEDGPIAECVAKAPGGPIHVLIEDDLAEHIPGCNFVVRKDALEAIGGFDPIYRTAGDDVDVCWRLQERGWTIGFHPSALVWHHRRNSIRAYWRQQKGYGKAEALLERKWPEKYNSAGHLNWEGRLYGAGVLRGFGLVSRVYHGMWNTAPFQLLYQPELPLWQALPQMPEWYLVNSILVALTLLGFAWTPLLWLTPLAVAGILLPAAQILAAVRKTAFSRPSLRWLAAAFFAIQPLARLWGRFVHGLTPWRQRGAGRRRYRAHLASSTWSEVWRAGEDWLELLRREFQGAGAIVHSGGDYDRWDLQIRGGVFTGVRIRLAVEEHGAGKQLLRWVAWPTVSSTLGVVCVALAGISVLAALQGAWIPAGVTGVWAGVVVVHAMRECAQAIGIASTALETVDGKFGGAAR